jgi:hypothetical protein
MPVRRALAGDTMLGRRVFFRAPPVAAERLAGMGVTCVTSADNHASDFGPDALRDTAPCTATGGSWR